MVSFVHFTHTRESSLALYYYNNMYAYYYYYYDYVYTILRA